VSLSFISPASANFAGDKDDEHSINAMMTIYWLPLFEEFRPECSTVPHDARVAQSDPPSNRRKPVVNRRVCTHSTWC